MEQRAEAFAQRQGFVLDCSRRLGFGSDGTVWATPRGTAVKVLERPRPYQAEKACYLRLQDRKVTEILGFTVPQLEGLDDELEVIEMTIVLATTNNSALAASSNVCQIWPCGFEFRSGYLRLLVFLF